MIVAPSMIHKNFGNEHSNYVSCIMKYTLLTKEFWIFYVLYRSYMINEKFQPVSP